MDRIIDSLRMAELIRGYVKGTLEKEEQEALRAWVEESEHHREMLEEFCSEEYPEIKDGIHALFDEEAGYRLFLRGKKQIDRRRIFQRVGTVAAVLLIGCCVAGGLLWERFRHTAEEVTVAEIIRPGRSCATLTLAGGEQILLCDTLFKQLGQPTAEVQIEGKQVNYRKNDSVNRLVWNKISIPRGGEYRLLLADGTQVWLNTETELKYPAAFGADCREVELKGEAYFEVAKDTARPFVVRTERMDVRVLGTCFDVKVYPDETVRTVLVSGSIEASGDGQKQVVRPGEQVAWQNGRLHVQPVNVEACIAWKDQRFVFDDELLEEVVKKLERWYDVEFFIRNASVRELRFTGNLPKYENLNHVLDKLELVTRIHFVQKGRTVVVEAD